MPKALSCVKTADDAGYDVKDQDLYWRGSYSAGYDYFLNGDTRRESDSVFNQFPSVCQAEENTEAARCRVQAGAEQEAAETCQGQRTQGEEAEERGWRRESGWRKTSQRRTRIR
mgnify:CR=1 FL=1